MSATPALNEAEELLATHLTELGVAYVRQWAYVPGRRFRADFAIWVESGHYWGVLIEIQGGVWQHRAHGSVKGVLADIERLNLATLHGYRVLRFVPDQVFDGSAKAFIAEVLAR